MKTKNKKQKLKNKSTKTERHPIWKATQTRENMKNQEKPNFPETKLPACSDYREGGHRFVNDA
jgi:hypothetical protein